MISKTMKVMLKNIAPLLNKNNMKLIRREVKKQYSKEGVWDDEHERELEKFLADIKK